MTSARSIRIPLVIGMTLALTSATLAPAASASEEVLPTHQTSISPDAQDDILDALEGLVGTQSTATIREIDESAPYAHLLVDADSGQTIAALEVEAPYFNQRAITQLGPGCTEASMCLRGPAPLGFIGSGSRTGAWGGITQVRTGDRAGSFDWNGSRNTHAAGRTVNITGGVTVTRTAR